MSRLIVKNLPNKITVETLKDIFGQKGEVTDVQLKYTKDGKFRNFGFVGFRSEEQAFEAKEYFNDSCIKSMKITVEICSNLGDEKKPRAWSKYAPDSTAYKKLHKDEIPKSPIKGRKLVKTSKSKIIELLKTHKDDPLFAEFIDAHVNEKTSWIREELHKAHQNEEVEDEIHTLQNEPILNSDVHDKTANKSISDLEYMKALIKKGDFVALEEKPEIQKKIRNRHLFYVKVTGLPFKCKKRDVKEFFRPLVPFSLRFPLGKGTKIAGFCYVGFRTEQELKKALIKDKLFLGSHRVHVHKYEDQTKKTTANEEVSEERKKLNQAKEEDIGESGSIFVRNLPYVCTEGEVTKVFEKYGPLSEVNMPIDKVLRQPKGYATVTFLMPEHAVRAYTELDGTVFCGRMLHLLPAKTEKDTDIDDDGLSFKEKKAKKIKSQAKSSHNWNTLFLGADAVANVIAANYNTTKERLLTENIKNTSAAVRLALGETQLVAETKSFLEDNGVYLESFSKPTKLRSKTCILVKNLPSQTSVDEIKPLFEKHGHIARFIMPKHGITALVDYIEPFEARKAFGKLAYSQFKSSPLYLEWAPENLFRKTEQNRQDLSKGTEMAETKDEVLENIEECEIKLIEESDNDMEDEPEKDTTLFVKNLNFTTVEDSLKALFSSCGKLYMTTIAKKKDPKNRGQFLSMGYGFVQFYKKKDANKALKDLQYTELDGKKLELKRSERGNETEVKTSRKTNKETTQNGTKILVRNVPFQANRNELHEIFRAFGEIKSLRLPKKLSPGSDQHRGFAFIDFHSKADAKSAFNALCFSTHLYGRRLVLEWADQIDENEHVDIIRKRTAKSFNANMPGGKKSMKATVDVETFVEG